jgi:DNA-binding NarL/FixJ family response regulator
MFKEPPLQTDAIQVLLVDDHALFRRGLARWLESEAGIRVLADVSSVAGALEISEQSRVDVVLLDYDLGAERGSRLAMEMTARGRPTRVLVVAAGLTDRQALELLQNGVAGIVMKAEPPETLVEAIRKVAAGEAWLKQEHLRLLAAGCSDAARPGERPFSEREWSVLRSVVEGLSNKQIAAELGISESSVKASLQQLFTRTGVRTRSQLVRIGLQHYPELLA